MNETKRPVMKVQLSILERILQGVSFGGIIGVITAVCVYWSKVPDRVPSHFGAAGKPDAWSGKGGLLILPITAVVLYALISLLERFPHIYNYVVEITQENAEYQYRNARTLMEWLKAEMVFMFAYIEWSMIRVALGKASSMGLIVLVFLAVLFVTIGYYIYRMVKPRDV